MQCKALRDSSREIRNYDVAYFMASTDNLEDNTNFAKMHEADFPILSDPNSSMSDAYGSLSPRGYASRWTFYIGKDGLIKMIDKKVNPAQAGEQLVANMEQLNFPRAAQ
jgi:peroxiredoxin Q/BCP|tara:strand:+ start:171 stop:497 length:327 start_codon:yes stop_codon:yes gene_type:complete